MTTTATKTDRPVYAIPTSEHHVGRSIFVGRATSRTAAIAQARAAAGLDGSPAGGEDSLFGLYEGVPLTQRGGEYHLVPPDRITIFRGPLERACASPQAIAREVRITVMHELGHHLGFEEDRLEELGLG